MAEPHIAYAKCLSCGHPRTGRYCSQCGEQYLDPHSLTVRHFLSHTLLHETLHLDGKIWRTARYLFLRPGFLAVEYFEGRRQPYLNPVRLLITAVILYFLLTQNGLGVFVNIRGVHLSLAPTSVREGTSIAGTIQGIDRFKLLSGLLASKDRAGKLAAEGASERFHASLEKFAEPLSFGNVVLLAVALFILFHHRRPLFVAHGVFSMHLVSFVLLSSLVFVPGIRLARMGGLAPVFILLAVVSLLQIFYLIAAIWRFYYGDDRRRVLPKFIAVGSAFILYPLNSAFLTLAQTAAAAIALARL